MPSILFNGGNKMSSFLLKSTIFALVASSCIVAYAADDQATDNQTVNTTQTTTTQTADTQTANTQNDDHAILQPNDLKWANGPDSLPKGAQVAILEGNPTQDGPFTIR